MESRIKYLDGLKQITCYLVLLAHYLMAYLPSGYIGYGTIYAQEDKYSVLIDNLPFSLFTNTSLQIYVFFAIISFVVTIGFYCSKDSQGFLERQAIKRYFRFSIPVAGAILLTYSLNRAGFLRFNDVYNISNSTWNLAMIPIDVSFWNALYIAFVKCFFIPSTGILCNLWCMDIIFIGSLLTYGFLAIVGKSKRRYAAYILCAFFMIAFPKYLIFLIGIVCGDFWIHGHTRIKLTVLKRNILACLLLLTGIAIGLIPSILVPLPLTLEHTYTMATGFFLFGIMLSEPIQKFLSTKIFVKLSKYSFSFLLVQVPILYGVSPYIFRFIYDASQHYLLAFWVMLAICAAISFIAAIGFYHIFEKPSGKLSDFIYNKISL